MATANEITQLAATLAQLAQTLAAQAQRPDPGPPQEPPRQMPKRIMLTAEEVADQLGIGRTLMYSLLKSGEIESVRIGRLRRIPAAAVSDYAARLVSPPIRTAA